MKFLVLWELEIISEKTVGTVLSMPEYAEAIPLAEMTSPEAVARPPE